MQDIPEDSVPWSELEAITKNRGCDFPFVHFNASSLRSEVGAGGGRVGPPGGLRDLQEGSEPQVLAARSSLMALALQ